MKRAWESDVEGGTSDEDSWGDEDEDDDDYDEEYREFDAYSPSSSGSSDESEEDGNAAAAYEYVSWHVSPVPAKSPEELERERLAREEELLTALSARGLELRSDSRLCANFISGMPAFGGWTAEKVAQRMAEMRWLHELPDFYEVQSHFDHYYDSGGGSDSSDSDYEGMSMFERTEMKLLERHGGYPKVFPWEAKIRRDVAWAFCSGTQHRLGEQSPVQILSGHFMLTQFIVHAATEPFADPKKLNDLL